MQLVNVGLGWEPNKGLWSEFLYFPSTAFMRESGCEAQRVGNNRQQNQKEKNLKNIEDGNIKGRNRFWK